MNCITRIFDSCILMGVLRITYFYFSSLLFVIVFSLFIYGAYLVSGIEFIYDIFYPIILLFFFLITSSYLVGVPAYLFYKIVLD